MSDRPLLRRHPRRRRRRDDRRRYARLLEAHRSPVCPDPEQTEREGGIKEWKQKGKKKCLRSLAVADERSAAETDLVPP